MNSFIQARNKRYFQLFQVQDISRKYIYVMIAIIILLNVICLL